MRILILLLLMCGSVQAANLDASLMVISDLHHSQVNDEITNNLSGLVNGILTDVPTAKTWVGGGDMFDTSVGDAGPFSTNAADLLSIFQSAGITFKSLSDAHDYAGGGDVYSSGLYPGRYWSVDLGDNWILLAIEDLAAPLFFVAIDAAAVSWLEIELNSAAAQNKNVIILTHAALWGDVEWPAETITPSAVSGSITITSDTPDTFSSDDIGRVIVLRPDSCIPGDVTCFGWGTITAFNSGTSVAVSIDNDLYDATPTPKWNFKEALIFESIINSDYIRALLEGYKDTVKLVLNGHLHANSSHTINGIEYREIGAATTKYIGPTNGKNTGALLNLYTDGSWKLLGTGNQASYNNKVYYISSDGLDTNGGALPFNPWSVTHAETNISVGDTVLLSSDLSEDIDFSGTSGNLTFISSNGTRKTISGNISGNYISIDNIKISGESSIFIKNSILNNLLVTP